jgi:hypothetical protein
MALYLAARRLELKLGWLFDFFVFVDDDADWFGQLSRFETFLQEWQPGSTLLFILASIAQIYFANV